MTICCLKEVDLKQEHKKVESERMEKYIRTSLNKSGVAILT